MRERLGQPYGTNTCSAGVLCTAHFASPETTGRVPRLTGKMPILEHYHVLICIQGERVCPQSLSLPPLSMPCTLLLADVPLMLARSYLLMKAIFSMICKTSVRTQLTWMACTSLWRDLTQILSAAPLGRYATLAAICPPASTCLLFQICTTHDDPPHDQCAG